MMKLTSDTMTCESVVIFPYKNTYIEGRVGAILEEDPQKIIVEKGGICYLVDMRETEVVKVHKEMHYNGEDRRHSW